MGPRIREDNGWGRDGLSPPVFVGQALLGNCGSGCGNDGLGREDGRCGKGKGPRIREDNGGDGRPEGWPVRRRGREGKAILRWAWNRIGLGEAKKENENRIDLSVLPNAQPGLRSTGGEGDGSPHPR